MGVRDPAAMYTAPVVFVVSVMFFPGVLSKLIARFYPANPGALIMRSSLIPKFVNNEFVNNEFVNTEFADIKHGVA
jgi:hypothetical protein